MYVDVEFSTVRRRRPCEGDAVADAHAGGHGVDADRSERFAEVVERRCPVRGAEDRGGRTRRRPSRLRRAHSAAPGSVTPSTSVESQARPISHRPNLRSGLTRYGFATAMAAAPAASASDGNPVEFARRSDAVGQRGDGAVDDSSDEQHTGDGEHEAGGPVAKQRPATTYQRQETDDDDPHLDQVERDLPHEVEEPGQRRQPVGEGPLEVTGRRRPATP